MPLPKERLQWIGIGAGAIVLAVFAIAFARGAIRVPTALRGKDLPPTVELTWTPAGATTLREFRGHLKLTDDRALDFTSYRFEVVEAGKTVGLPIEGMIGKQYESDVSLALLESYSGLVDKKEVHLKLSIADDAGQRTEIEKTVILK